MASTSVTYSPRFSPFCWFPFDSLRSPTSSVTDLGLLNAVESHIHSVYNSCSEFVRSSFSNSSVAPLLGAVGAMGLGAAAYYYTTNGKEVIANQCSSSSMFSNRGYHKIKPLVDLKNQTTELKDGSRVVRFMESDHLSTHLFSEVRTVYEAIRRGAKESHNGECLGYRKKLPDGSSPYRWIRYDDVIRRAENLAQGFLDKGLTPGQQTNIGIYSVNRPEWTITEQACYVYSMICVPLYDTLGLDACSFIIKQTDMQLVVIDRSQKAEHLLKRHADFQTLRHVVLIETAESSLLKLASECGVEISQFDAVELLGGTALKKTPKQPPNSDDISTICYTSGTTGTPKGAMLTHGNIVADCTAMAMIKHTQPCSADTIVSFLPLAHMFERMLETIVLIVGGRVGFYSGDIRKLSEDLMELKPTIMPAVPRILNRIYDATMQEVSKDGNRLVSALKKYLVNLALAAKMEDLKKSVVRTDSIWDMLVFKRVRNRVGGKVRLVITGSAACSTDILSFVRASLGCVVLEGYGQTECVACVTVSLEGDHTPGHVGCPIPCSRIKLIDVPEMNYYAKDRRGEVCIFGHNVFKGYYKDPEHTAEALDEDGWLHTGDIGCWTPEGTLKLIDRKKHIFKLSQGEYIAPEKIEAVYARCKLVAQCYVHGESLKSCLVGIVVPDFTILLPYVDKELNIKTKEPLELCKNEVVKKAILNHMNSEGKKAGMASFEQVKDVHLYPELFSIDNGLLTPTFKSKRPALRDFFKEPIARMYSRLS